MNLYSAKLFVLLFLSTVFVLKPSLMLADINDKDEEEWVNNTYQSLSEDERIAQLFMIATYFGQDEEHYSLTENFVKKYNVGGIVFYKGKSGNNNQVELTNRYQLSARVPLFIGMDAEWGLGMRHVGLISFPKQMTLGAIKDDNLIYDMGVEIARQLSIMGVNINFAPVLDINNNPKNPVIGRRSFGECKKNVTNKGIAYMNGLQKNGILAVGKHFPGHGDTEVDSHKALPVVNHDTKRLHDIELYPFKQCIKAGILGIMTAHINMPKYDTHSNLPATLSKYIISDLLRNELGFSGLIFTDALNMKAITNNYESGIVELLALKAGNDVLVFSEDLPKATEIIKKAIKDNELDEKEIELKVKKILRTKYQMNLINFSVLDTNNIEEKINTEHAFYLKQKLFEKAITVVSNNNNLIPLIDLQNKKIAVLSITNNLNNEAILENEKSVTSVIKDQISDKSCTSFIRMIKKYAPVTCYSIQRTTLTKDTVKDMCAELKKYNVVIVALHDILGLNNTNFSFTIDELDLLKELESNVNLVVIPFGNVYCLENLTKHKNLIMAYEDDPIAAKVVAQIIFGAIPADGQLPISINSKWHSGWGIKTKSIKRLGYSYPESVNMDNDVLKEIDVIVGKAIEDQVFPGCQILISRKGKVVFEKSYGYYTYEKDIPVDLDTIYDIASVTKVAGPLQAIMHLYSHKKINLKNKISDYLHYLKKTNKRNLRIEHILAHQSGLKPHIIKDLKSTIVNGDNTLKDNLFSKEKSNEYPHQLGKDLFCSKQLADLAWQCCINSELLSKKPGKNCNVEYSCTAFYFLQHLIEKIVNEPLDKYLQKTFYGPLGLYHLSFCPLQNGQGETRITPTEIINAANLPAIAGIVHDPMASLVGGVAGNAGLFSNANDLAIILQMNLQDGYYGGKRYFKNKIIGSFTKKYSKKPSSKGLGWHKPCSDSVFISEYASSLTYAHAGFTGTCVCVDPKYDLIYVFLSNRVYPTASNNKINEQKIRAKIHSIVYKAMKR